MHFFHVLLFVFFSIEMASSFSSTWPDPNSRVLSKIDFGVPLVDLFKWLDIRDIFLGQNTRKQDITAALALARDCKHPDAEWLTSIFEGKDVSTKEEAKEVFLLSQDGDARALCFAWWLSDDFWYNLTLLCRAAELGNVFACSTFCRRVRKDEEAFRLAQFAAARHERDGFYSLGRFSYGIGGEENLTLAKENYLIAAELGFVDAAVDYGLLLGESDPAHWLWSSRAALRGVSDYFLDSFPIQVERFSSGAVNASIMFEIGLALKGKIDTGKKAIFGSTRNFDSIVGPANQAFSFYDSQIKSALSAVDTWTIIGIRFGIVKDVRKLIGKIIWDARVEANYPVQIESKNARQCSIQ